jgi:hypothetical protein
LKSTRWLHNIMFEEKIEVLYNLRSVALSGRECRHASLSSKGATLCRAGLTSFSPKV